MEGSTSKLKDWPGQQEWIQEAYSFESVKTTAISIIGGYCTGKNRPSGKFK